MNSAKSASNGRQPSTSVLPRAGCPMGTALRSRSLGTAAGGTLPAQTGSGALCPCPASLYQRAGVPILPCHKWLCSPEHAQRMHCGSGEGLQAGVPQAAAGEGAAAGTAAELTLHSRWAFTRVSNAPASAPLDSSLQRRLQRRTRQQTAGCWLRIWMPPPFLGRAVLRAELAAGTRGSL